jgi:hypothetical protein
VPSENDLILDLHENAGNWIMEGLELLRERGLEEDREQIGNLIKSFEKIGDETLNGKIKGYRLNFSHLKFSLGPPPNENKAIHKYYGVVMKLDWLEVR